MANTEIDDRLIKLLESLGLPQDFKPVKVRPTLCAPYGDDLSELGFNKVEWAPYIWQGDIPLAKDHELLAENRVFAIGLASVVTCLQLNLRPGDKVLDMCAAPGIKSLYLQILHKKKLELYVNDISNERLIRLRTLFEQFDMPLPAFSHQPGQTLHMRYKPHYFNAVIIDAPCSGEGNALAGDESALETWSMAKVKRLAQLQRKLLKTGQALLKENSQFLYATCTLNMYENERALEKAGFSIQPILHTKATYVQLQDDQALRIEPSHASIGFFMAKLGHGRKKDKVRKLFDSSE